MQKEKTEALLQLFSLVQGEPLRDIQELRPSLVLGLMDMPGIDDDWTQVFQVLKLYFSRKEIDLQLKPDQNLAQDLAVGLLAVATIMGQQDWYSQALAAMEDSARKIVLAAINAFSEQSLVAKNKNQLLQYAQQLEEKLKQSEAKVAELEERLNEQAAVLLHYENEVEASQRVNKLTQIEEDDQVHLQTLRLLREQQDEREAQHLAEVACLEKRLRAAEQKLLRANQHNKRDEKDAQIKYLNSLVEKQECALEQFKGRVKALQEEKEGLVGQNLGLQREVALLRQRESERRTEAKGSRLFSNMGQQINEELQSQNQFFRRRLQTLEGVKTVEGVRTVEGIKTMESSRVIESNKQNRTSSTAEMRRVDRLHRQELSVLLSALGGVREENRWLRAQLRAGLGLT